MYPCKPIFPAPPAEQEDLHRTWIRKCVRMSERGEEWALAQFALDNLQSRAAHLRWNASQVRKVGGLEEGIQIACAALLEEFAEWRQRRLFIEEDEKDALEDLWQPDTNVMPTFLDYPPLVNRNSFYACLLNEYRSAVLFVTFIAYPVIGVSCVYDDMRMTQAVELCRAVGTMGDTLLPVPLVRVLQLAGLVFASRTRYPPECEWIEDQLDILKYRGVAGADKVKEMLQLVWTSSHPWLYEETERMMQNEEDLAILGGEELYEK